MSQLEFIATIIHSIVWPGAVLTVILLFRKNITERIQNIEKIRYQDFEFVFQHKMENVRAKLNSVDMPLMVAKTENTDNNLTIFHLKEISPLKAIQQAWSTLETSLNKIISPTASTETIFHKIIRLRDQYQTTPSIEYSIIELHDLRNLAVKNQKEYITFSSAFQYYELVKKAILFLQEYAALND